MRKVARSLCVILHYGSEGDTNRCIGSLTHEEDIDIVISDNDPRQSYAPPKELKDFVSVIKTGGVAGFAEGNNIGVDAFLSEGHDSIFILNNDTIVIKGALEALRDTLSCNQVGAVGPCMPYASDPLRVWACGGFINKFTLSIGGLQPKDSSSYTVDYLPGAAILCRADLWKRIGGFNEAYFLAYEEAEFCLEVKKRGFRVMVDPRAIVLHRVGMSSQRKPEHFYNIIRNKLVLARYIYGRDVGFIYGLIITLLSVKGRRAKPVYLRIRLWLKAVHDDIAGVCINRDIFDAISRSYSSHSK